MATSTYQGLRGAAARFYDGTIAAAVAVLVAVPRLRNFLFSFVYTIIFFYPSIRANSTSAGFLYTGDVLGFYTPSLMKMRELISTFNFQALDLNLFNGSSSFYLIPNFFGVHPFFVIYSLLSKFSDPRMWDVAHVLVLICALHVFLGSYFTLKLCQKHLGLTFAGAAIVASFFVFGIGTVNALPEPMFVFCYAIVPWCIYSALRFEETRRVLYLPLAAFPVVIVFLAGYIPLGVACLFFSGAFITFKIFGVDGGWKELNIGIRRVLVAAIPFLFAAAVVAPYLLAVHEFLQESPSSRIPSLYYSAHQMADLPQSIARLVTFNIPVAGPFFETTVQWGIIPFSIVLLFLALPKAGARLSPREWTILSACAVGYFATVLSIYGVYTPISDLVFYFVPEVGEMHIYQRFLLPANLLFGIVLAVMLEGVLRTTNRLPFRIAALGLIVLTLGLAYWTASSDGGPGKTYLRNLMIFELTVATVFAAALIAPGRNFRLWVAVVLIGIAPLNAMYNFARGDNSLPVRKAQLPVTLDPVVQQGIVNFFQQRSGKSLIKYVDLTPMWTEGREAFPKSFPYIVSPTGVALSSYTGFNFYLSPRSDYMSMMPIVGNNEQSVDWDYVRRTGGDFVVANQRHVAALQEAGFVGDLANSLALPADVIILPLVWQGRAGAPYFDNGYFRISKPQPDFASSSFANIAAGKAARQSSTLGTADAGLAVDGNASGAFTGGSVSHTNVDPNAWLEIDLGGLERIDAVRIWNRTDCCQERLADASLMISEEPFAADDTIASAAKRDGVWVRKLGGGPSATVDAGGVEGRYVRIQMGGRLPAIESYLALAEVEVLQGPAQAIVAGESQAADPVQVHDFQTNEASTFEIAFTSSEPVALQYQLWKNPRLRFYLNGQKVFPEINQNVATLIVGPGDHQLVAHYTNKALTWFWVIYAFYGVLLVLSFAAELVASWRTRRARRATVSHHV